MRSRSLRDHDAGTVVAEFAVALPAVVLVLACCLGALRVGVEQLRLSDASAAAARVLGRGDPVALANEIVRAHSGGRITAIGRDDGLVCVSVGGSVRIGSIDTLPLTERSCALSAPG